jgi:hypothetical protein
MAQITGVSEIQSTTLGASSVNKYNENGYVKKSPWPLLFRDITRKIT